RLQAVSRVGYQPRRALLLLLFARAYSPTLFPYTTLFRSRVSHGAHHQAPWMGGDERRDVGLGEHGLHRGQPAPGVAGVAGVGRRDRKSTRLNSSHVSNSYAVVCLKKQNITDRDSAEAMVA